VDAGARLETVGNSLRIRLYSPERIEETVFKPNAFFSIVCYPVSLYLRLVVGNNRTRSQSESRDLPVKDVTCGVCRCGSVVPRRT